MGLGEKIKEFSWLKGDLKPSNIAYIGLRDIDAGEKRILKEKGISAFSMHHVDRYGIGKVVELALDAVNPNRDKPIHLSFDVDALDPSVAPSTGTPVGTYSPVSTSAQVDIGERWPHFQRGPLHLRGHLGDWVACRFRHGGMLPPSLSV